MMCPAGGCDVKEQSETHSAREPRVGSPPADTFARLCAGRLVEVRVRRLAEVADLVVLNAGVSEAVRRAGPRAVICADYRVASPVSCEVADGWSRAMRETNSMIERSALLLDPANVTFNLQVERIVRCAGNPLRRLFTSAVELELWMCGSLEEQEHRALRAFLAWPQGAQNSLKQS
jgi:hypothetical protein